MADVFVPISFSKTETTDTKLRVSLRSQRPQGDSRSVLARIAKCKNLSCIMGKRCSLLPVSSVWSAAVAPRSLSCRSFGIS